MLRSENVAMPLTTGTVLVPDSAPGISKPPLRPIAIVTVPLKPVIVFPRSSSTATRTVGMVPRGSVVVGCVRKTRFVATGLRVTTVVSHEAGELKNQVHCGSTLPPVGKAAYSPSIFEAASDIWVTLANGAWGCWTPVSWFASVTPYTSPPAFTDSGPTPAGVGDEPEPDAERAVPTDTVTPRYAEIITPPLVTA